MHRRARRLLLNKQHKLLVSPPQSSLDLSSSKPWRRRGQSFGAGRANHAKRVDPFAGAYGRITNVTLPEGDSRAFTYDGRGNVLKTTFGAKSGGGSFSTSTTYDATCANAVKCNQPNTTTDANGNVTTYSYDATSGLLSSVVYPAGSAGAPHEVDIQRSQQYASYIQAAGAGPTQGPSAVSLVTGVTEGCATTQTCPGTANSLQDTILYGPNSGANNLEPTQVTKAAGDGSLSVSMSINYNPVGDRSSVTDGNGNATAFFYDSDHEQVGTIGPDPDGAGPLANRATRYTFNPDGLITQVDDGTTSGQTSSAFANLNTLASTITSFDSLDRKIQQSIVVNGSIQRLGQFAYDAANRLQCYSIRENAATFTSEPSSACTLGTAGSFGPDHIYYYTYDANNAPLTRLSGYGTASQRSDVVNSYFADGELASQADAKGNLTSYIYDLYNRLATVYFPSPTNVGTSSSTDFEQFARDNNGNVISDRRRDGVTVSYSYDAMNNRLVSPNGAALAYDVMNRLVSSSLSGQTVTATYDGLGRQRQQISPLGTITRGFDANGNRTQLTFPDGLIFNYAFDAVNELISVSDGSGVTLETISYDNLGRRSVINRPGVGTSTYGYDGASRLNTLSHTFTDNSKNNSLTYSYSPAS